MRPLLKKEKLLVVTVCSLAAFATAAFPWETDRTAPTHHSTNLTSSNPRTYTVKVITPNAVEEPTRILAKIQRSPGSGGAGTWDDLVVIDANNGDPTIEPFDGRIVPDPGRAPSTTYKYRCWARYDDGSGPVDVIGNEVTITTPA